MSTMKALTWAFGLQGLRPVEKLLAIYFAGHAGTNDDGVLRMDIMAHDSAIWCGCLKEEIEPALSRLSNGGLIVEEIGPWLWVVELVFAPAPRQLYS